MMFVFFFTFTPILNGDGKGDQRELRCWMIADEIEKRYLVKRREKMSFLYWLQQN